jgi:hypothetical protein
VPVNETLTPWNVTEREKVLPVTVAVSVGPRPVPRQEPITADVVDVTVPFESVKFASTNTGFVPGALDVAFACQGPETSAFCGGGGTIGLLDPPPQPPKQMHAATARAGKYRIESPFRV